MHFFPHGGVRWYIFASFTLPCQTSFCQCLSPASCHMVSKCNGWQGWSSSAIPSTSASHIPCQHNKIRGITSGAALTRGCASFLAKVKDRENTTAENREKWSKASAYILYKISCMLGEALWQSQFQHDQKSNSPRYANQKFVQVILPWCYHTRFLVCIAGCAFEDIFR